VGPDALTPALSDQVVVGNNAPMALELSAWLEHKDKILSILTEQQHKVARGSSVQGFTSKQIERPIEGPRSDR